MNFCMGQMSEKARQNRRQICPCVEQYRKNKTSFFLHKESKNQGHGESKNRLNHVPMVKGKIRAARSTDTPAGRISRILL